MSENIFKRLGSIIKGLGSQDASLDPASHEAGLQGWKESEKKARESGVPDITFNSNIERCISTVCAEKGCSRVEAIKMIEDSVFRTGVSYKDYVRYSFFRKSEAQQRREQNALNFKIQRRVARKSVREEELVEAVMAATGWDRDHAVSEMRYADDYCGIPYKYFLYSRYWEIDKSTWNEYFSRGQTEQLNRIYNSDPRIVNTVANKGEFCRTYGKFLGRQWLLTQGATFDSFKETFEGIKKIIYKPLASSGGYGIRTFELEGADLKAVFAQIKKLRPGILEEFIIQHPDMRRLSESAVNTIRMVTIMTRRDLPGIEPGKVYVMYAGARFATGNSVTDNLHSGGLVAGVDLEKGCIATNAVDYEYNVCEVHPDTGQVIKGFKIPYFREAVEMIRSAASINEGYFGWDVAITEHGPTIVECNSFPGAGILQMPYIPLRKGMRYIFEPFLIDLKDVSPSAPKEVAIEKVDDEGITVRWTKAPSSDGYVLYRGYTPDGQFKEAGRANGATLSFIDADFDRSQDAVYYQVRSYITRGNGTKEFSEASAAAAAHARKEAEMIPHVLVLRKGAEDTLHAYKGWSGLEGAVWTSGDPEIASVDGEGKVSAVSDGSCTITCKSSDGSLSASAEVTVERKPAQAGPAAARYTKDASGIYRKASAGSSKKAVIMLAGSLNGFGKTAPEGYPHPAVDADGFRQFSEFASDADLRIGHLNTLLSDSRPYSFENETFEDQVNVNMPSWYIDAAAGAFDALSVTGSFFLKADSRSAEETLVRLDERGIIHKGTEDAAMMFDVNGIKLAVLSYMSAYTENEDVFSAERAASDIAECRVKGADFVIVYIDWETCRSKAVHPLQVSEATEAAEAGADFVAGFTAYSAQQFSMIVTKDGRVVPVAYSGGNFQVVSNQKALCEGALYRLQLSKGKGGRTAIDDITFIPMTVRGYAPQMLDRNSCRKAHSREYRRVRNRIIKTVGDCIVEE